MVYKTRLLEGNEMSADITKYPDLFGMSINDSKFSKKWNGLCFTGTKHNLETFSLENLLISSSSWGIKNRKHCKMNIIFFYLFVFLFKMDFQLFYNHVGPVEERCSCREGTRILMRYNCQLSCHSTKGNYH